MMGTYRQRHGCPGEGADYLITAWDGARCPQGGPSVWDNTMPWMAQYFTSPS